MTTWFISRHLGALQWIHRHGPRPLVSMCCTSIPRRRIILYHTPPACYTRFFALLRSVLQAKPARVACYHSFFKYF